MVLTLIVRTALGTLLVLTLFACSAGAAGKLAYHSCAGVQGAPKDAKCATLGVFENRAARAGRRINIGIVILPARRQNSGAIFGISGGPGQSAADGIPIFTQGPLKALRDTHDFVLVDQRGTRYSNQQQCLLYKDPTVYFEELFPHVAVQRCRDALARRADLNQYGTSVAADDLDDVRAALGYERIELWGGSYGTEAAQEYARRHPDHVRALLLESVATTNFLVPLPFARGAQRALDQLIGDCAAVPDCQATFPHLRAHFDALLHRFNRGTIRVELASKGTQRSLLLSREVFVDRLRQLLYSPQVAVIVPRVIEDAYNGNTKPLATAMDFITKSIADLLSWGMAMSVSCSEDDPFITPAEAAMQSRGTFMGDARLAAQHRACVAWRVRPINRSYLQPVRSNAPILMLSGSDDPATPPQYAQAQLRYYPNGRQILIPHGGHDNESPCLDRIRIAFLDTADTKAVDARCISGFKRPPFILTDKALNALFASPQ